MLSTLIYLCERTKTHVQAAHGFFSDHFCRLAAKLSVPLEQEKPRICGIYLAIMQFLRGTRPYQNHFFLHSFILN